MAKGKSKGKGKNDGKFNTCGGDGHYSRNCPSTPGPGMSTTERHGCVGREHSKTQGPTANPHLKGGGDGWESKSGWGKGSGKHFWEKGGGEAQGKG